MSTPLSVYTAPKGATPLPMAPVDVEQVGQWAAQTEIEVGSGYARRGGRWKVELATLDSENEALALYDRAVAAGYAVRIKPQRVADGVYRYAVRVMQLPSRAEAVILAEKLAHALALAEPVVTETDIHAHHPPTQAAFLVAVLFTACTADKCFARQERHPVLMTPHPTDTRIRQETGLRTAFNAAVAFGFGKIDETLDGEAVIVGTVTAAGQFFGFSGCTAPQFEGKGLVDAGLVGDPR
jgi:hypothetical protein